MVLAQAGARPSSYCTQTLRNISIQRPLACAPASRCGPSHKLCATKRQRQYVVQAQQQGDSPQSPQELSLVSHIFTVGPSTQVLAVNMLTPTGCTAAAQAPVKPQSPVGEMLAYYYKAQPHLFKDAIEEQLRRLRDERDDREVRRKAAEAEKMQDAAAATSSMDITLYK